MAYKAKFYQRGRHSHLWVIPPELDVTDEVLPGQKMQIKKSGKIWQVVDVTWCFVRESGESVFDHFNVGVV